MGFSVQVSGVRLLASGYWLWTFGNWVLNTGVGQLIVDETSCMLRSAFAESDKSEASDQKQAATSQKRV